MESAELILTLAGGLGAALLFGYFTQRLGLSPIVGYLLAGVVIGPYTPGYVGDSHAANQLAEVGVILLMFGVGLHFSVKDHMTVRGIAIPGAIAQIVTATLIGAGLRTNADVSAYRRADCEEVWPGENDYGGVAVRTAFEYSTGHCVSARPDR